MTYAVSRPGAEGDVRVGVLRFGGALFRESFRLEGFWILKELWIVSHAVDRNDDIGSGGNDLVITWNEGGLMQLDSSDGGG